MAGSSLRADGAGVPPIPWTWGSKIGDQLLREGLFSVKHLFRGRVLDLGCGKKPYLQLLDGRGTQWVGLDFEETRTGRSDADVFGSALETPFAASTFDVVLSTQVLEHVARPVTLLLEVHRVLKHGGYLVLTAPQTNPLHEEPHDYFRYTSHGLRSLADTAGLQVIEIRPLGGAIATVGQMIVWHLSWIGRIPFLGHTIHGIANASTAWAVLKLDRFSNIYGGGALKDTLNWLLVARKRH